MCHWCHDHHHNDTAKVHCDNKCPDTTNPLSQHYVKPSDNEKKTNQPEEKKEEKKEEHTEPPRQAPFNLPLCRMVTLNSKPWGRKE